MCIENLHTQCLNVYPDLAQYCSNFSFCMAQRIRCYRSLAKNVHFNVFYTQFLELCTYRFSYVKIVSFIIIQQHSQQPMYQCTTDENMWNSVERKVVDMSFPPSRFPHLINLLVIRVCVLYFSHVVWLYAILS